MKAQDIKRSLVKVWLTLKTGRDRLFFPSFNHLFVHRIRFRAWASNRKRLKMAGRRYFLWLYKKHGDKLESLYGLRDKRDERNRERTRVQYGGDREWFS